MTSQILEHPTLVKKNQCINLANALEATEEMLVLARAGKWESVEKLELNRRKYLDDCFALPANQNDLQLFSDALSALLSLNETLITCVYETRESIEKQKQSTKQTFMLASQYLNS